MTRPRPAGGKRWLRRLFLESASAALALALLVWSLTPVYNMLLIALDRDEGDIEFAGILWPPAPSTSAAS